MQISLSINKLHPGSSVRLVADLLQVLAQLGNAAKCVGGLHFGGVVCDEEGLGGLVGDDAFLALCYGVLVAV